MSDQNNNDQSMRRITPDDLPPDPKAAITPRAARNYATPDGWTERSQPQRRERNQSCEGCGGAGYYLLRVPYGHPQFGKPQPCDCASYQRQRAPAAARLGDELGSLAHKTFASFDITRPIMPTVWQGKALSSEAQRVFLADAHRRCEAWAENPRGWLFLHGAFGAGKSHLAAAIANEQQQAGAIVRFMTINKLLDILKAAIDTHSSESLIDDLISAGVLILDELAAAHLAECASDWRFGRIERLINERLDRPTIITSNLAPDDLAQPGDLRAERLADRIAGNSQIVWMPIASYRRLSKEVAS